MLAISHALDNAYTPTPAARNLTPLGDREAANGEPEQDRTTVLLQSLIHILTDNRPPEDLRATVEALVRKYSDMAPATSCSLGGEFPLYVETVVL